NMSVKKIEKELSQQIKNQIEKTLNKGEELKADLLNISVKPYRYQNKTWDKNTINDFKKELIKDINVKIIIDETINYKR
ncbi:Ger(x)C family spore germination C-terminal domain-containing protein, partial [Neobacillus niacini]|uniref:Ger(x)C family spore germination C-terminal domain-containing protein n=1 Tax=Neobacillus niacini TaxID=86668 RepID=UPI002FFFF788